MAGNSVVDLERTSSDDNEAKVMHKLGIPTKETKLQQGEPSAKLPTVAVCIPSKDRAEDLTVCLTSIAKQTRSPDRVMVIDQSSVQYSIPSDSQVDHLYDPGLSGAAAARNAAIDRATEDLVFFLDDDVELFPDCMAELLAYASEHPEAIAIQANIVDTTRGFNLSRIHSAIFRRGFFNNSRIQKNGLIELRVIAGGATAFRRELFQYEKFDERLVAHSYGEDWEFAHRARQYGKLILAEKARMYHHASATNRHKYEQILRDRWDNSLYFFNKLNAAKQPINRFWRLWWMLGESLLWLRVGLGFPLFGIRTRRAPQRTLSLQQ